VPTSKGGEKGGREEWKGRKEKEGRLACTILGPEGFCGLFISHWFTAAAHMAY